ncbi:2EXR domain-containing protein [Aspergillus melleus]|uniref:2EXR domain-containing protein n=1 Tax=Aspergillus melleus TaxID=138277 RepID=UPI001E8D9192|nr:uncharacterized protein LDX57_000277 [Aspergillus melleus]KAH8422523.1 hypothetical protein LDX57_000277 [Aspergillus melleus]
MALQSFHLFPSLPTEIRRMIYIFATPPRVVRIKGVAEDKDEFLRNLNTIAFERRLCPSLTHFAHHWRGYIPKNFRHPTLKGFGFTGARPRYQPWELSDATPEISIKWLAEEPRLAWVMLRESYMYSDTSIPALLHVCRESRKELERLGYELAFRTRLQGPRTWFNFKGDVMYITRVRQSLQGLENDLESDSEGDMILSGNMIYDVGQFHPCDLTRVKRLALEGGGPLLFPFRRQLSLISTVSSILSLFGHLSELLLSEWEEEDIARWKELGPHWEGNLFNSINQREHRCCLAVEEIDALHSIVFPDGCRNDLGSVGQVAEILKAYQQHMGSSFRYFEHRQDVIERDLTAARDAMITLGPHIPVLRDPWPIPKVRAVHTLPESMAERMRLERQVAWERLYQMNRDWRKAIEGDPTNTYSRDRAMTPQLEMADSPPFSWQTDDHDGYSDTVVFSIYSDEQIESDTLLWGRYRPKSWWTQKGVVSKPGHEILL